MKLNTNSNSYIIIYSAILVVIVAFLLAFVYQALKPMQDANVALDIKKQILYSLNIRNLDGAEAEAKYAEVVKAEKDLEGQKVYECQVDGKDVVVASLKGMGLWGGISGYIAIDNDGKVLLTLAPCPPAHAGGLFTPKSKIMLTFIGLVE